jgi:ATP-dependent Zn protease
VLAPVSTSDLERYYIDHGLVAYHESGHVLVAHHFRWAIARVEIGMLPDHGETQMTRGYFDPFERLCVQLAGVMAERCSHSWDDALTGPSGAAASDDQRGIEQALHELGWRSAEPAETEVDLILLDHRRALHRLAGTLRDRRALDGDQVRAIIDG